MAKLLLALAAFATFSWFWRKLSVWLNRQRKRDDGSSVGGEPSRSGHEIDPDDIIDAEYKDVED